MARTLKLLCALFALAVATASPAKWIGGIIAGGLARDLMIRHANANADPEPAFIKEMREDSRIQYGRNPTTYEWDPFMQMGRGFRGGWRRTRRMLIRDLKWGD